MSGIQESKGYIIIKEMMAAQDRQPFIFQEKTGSTSTSPHYDSDDQGLRLPSPEGDGVKVIQALRLMME